MSSCPSPGPPNLVPTHPPHPISSSFPQGSSELSFNTHEQVAFPAGIATLWNQLASLTCPSQGSLLRVICLAGSFPHEGPLGSPIPSADRELYTSPRARGYVPSLPFHLCLLTPHTHTSIKTLSSQFLKQNIY